MSQYSVYHLRCKQTTVTYDGTKMKLEVGPPPYNRRVKVIFVARPLVTPVAQMRVGVIMVCSREKRMLFRKHYFVSKSSAAAARGACSNVYVS
jgi:hypothetical protein